ncbi:MAG: hypothetical protein PW734_05445 [Verrucomicrobium sp.]|nr:hypothetical protein [Verrucomicrobium sp.]
MGGAPLRADVGGLGGLLFLVVAIVVQLLNGLRRGKIATPPPPRPAPARPVPPAPSRAREIWEEVRSSVAVVPPPVFVPAPAPPLPEGWEEAARRMEAAEAVTVDAPAPARLRLRVEGREAWQRAIVLSEVLQPPLALRPDWNP